MRGRATSLALALLLAGATVGAVVRARSIGPRVPPPLLAGAEREKALDLAQRLARGLLALARPDGGFDRLPGEKDMDPTVRDTISSALAVAALGRLTRAGIAVDGMDAALARGLDLLKKRQAEARGGGGFGALPPGIGTSPWPALHAISAGLLALCAGGRPEDAASLQGASSAYVRAATYGTPKGWTRAIATMALDYAYAVGKGALFGPSLRDLVQETPADAEQVDCHDFRVSEAIARVARGGSPPPTFPPAVLGACLQDPAYPKWTGDSTDLESWWMQAWIAARLPGGGEWFRRILPALEESQKALGRIPEGYYSDTVTQTACGILVLVEGLEARGA